MVRHLNSDNYVTYTYAAITIDRVLFIKKGTQLLCVRIPVTAILCSSSDPRFSQADIHDLAADLLDALLSKIETAGPPEKVAENDHLMKCKTIAYSCSQMLTSVCRRDAHNCHCTLNSHSSLSASPPTTCQYPWHHCKEPEQSKFRPVHL